jgi:hypothetical protein
MKIIRIGETKHMHMETERIVFNHDDIEYVITPEPDEGFRIHRSDGDCLAILPCAKNEIIVR